MGSEIFALDILTILTAYIFLIYGQTGSCIFALGQGFFIDLYSGGMHGLFTFLHVCVFGGIWLGSRFFNLQTPKGQMFIVSLALLLKIILFIMMVATFSQGIFSIKSFLWVSGALVIGTGLFAPILFLLFDRLRAAVIEDINKGSAEQL